MTTTTHDDTERAQGESCGCTQSGTVATIIDQAGRAWLTCDSCGRVFWFRR